MAYYYKVGEAWKFKVRPKGAGTEYAKTLRAKMQQKLESLPPPQKVTPLAEMSPEKQAAIRALYANGPTRKR